MSAPQPDRSPVPRSGTTLLGSSRANGASGRKAGKAAAANLARRGSSKKQLTAAADDEAQDKITCCLCFFIVVSVILGVIAVTSISFIAFFQADFQSYENVYSEAAEFMGTDVLHQVEAVTVVSSLMRAQYLGGDFVLGQNASDAYFEDMKEVLVAFDSVYMATPAGRMQGAGATQGGVDVVYNVEPGASCLQTYDYDPSTGQRVSTVNSETCPYIVTQRPWYTAAVALGRGTWSSLYVGAVTGKLMTTYSLPVYNKTNSLVAVVGIDMPLLLLEKVLTERHALPTGRNSFAMLFTAPQTTILATTLAADEAVLESLWKTQPNSLPTISSSALSARAQAAAALITESDTALQDASWTSSMTSDPVVVLRQLIVPDAPELHWRVAIVAPAQDRLTTKRTSLAQSVLLIVCVVGTTALACFCQPSMRWKLRAAVPDTGATEAALEMKNLAFHKQNSQGRKMRVARRSMMRALEYKTTPGDPNPSGAKGTGEDAMEDLFADTDSDEELMSKPKRTRKEKLVRLAFSGDGITVLCIVALMMSYSVWNFAGMVEFDNPVKALAETSNSRLEGTVARVVNSSARVVDLNVDAVGRGQIPTTVAQLQDDDRVHRMEAYFADLLVLYNTTTTPLQRVFVGFEHGAMYSATYEKDGIALGYADNTTQGRVVFRYMGANGIKNMSGPPIRESVFAVADEDWYRLAAYNTSSFGRVYSFFDAQGAPSLGYDVYQRFKSPDGIVGVMGVSVNLDAMQDIIRNFGFDADAASIYITEQPEFNGGQMHVVASSSGARFKLPEDGTVVRALASDSPDTLVGKTNALIEKEGGIAAVRGELLAVGQGVERMWMSVSSVSTGGLTWDLVVAFRQASFTVGIRDWQDVAFLVGGGSIIITGFVTITAIASARRKAAKAARKAGQRSYDPSKSAMADKFDHLVMPLTTSAPSEQSLTESYTGVTSYLESMGRIALSLRPTAAGEPKPSIAHMLWQKVSEVAGVLPELDSELHRAEHMRIARWIVESSLQDQNPVRQLAIHVIHRKAKWPLQLYRVRSHPMYTLTILAVVMGLLGLTFAEARVNAATDDHLVRTVLAIEVVLLAILSADLAVYWVLHAGRTLRRVEVPNSSSRSIEYSVVGKPAQRVQVGTFRTCLVVVMFLDWCLRAATRYSTGAQGVNLFIPWTVLLRPAMLFSLSPVLRHATVNLALTIVQSKLVFALGASFVMVAAVTSGTLLSREKLENSEGLGRGFTDFRSTFLTMFIFLATGENYPDVVDEPVKTISPWFAVYFTVFSFVGMFLLLSLLVAYFQKYYVAEYDAKGAVNDALRMIRRRTGLLLAFYLLKDLETQANQQMSRNMRKYHARAAAKQFSKGAYNPRMVKATQHLRVLAAPTKIRRETFDSFFVSCGVRLPSTSDLRRRNRERFEAFKYDTEHFVASLQRRVIRGGCDEAFLRLTSEFAERCQHLHVQARRNTQVAAVDMAAFVMECERLSTKLLSGNTLADVEAIRDRASIVQSFRSKEQSASTTQSTSWFRQKLRDFFDDKLLVPYESTVVLLLLIHSTLLALTLSKLGQPMLSWVAYFSLVYIVEIGLRLHCEGWADFWTFKRLERQHHQVGAKSYGASALRYDFVIVFTMAVLFMWSRIAEGRISWPGDDPWRIVVTLPVLRLLSTVHATRILVFGLLASLPSFLALFGLLAVLHYCYAVIGVVWFGGKIKANTASAATAGVDFDTFTAALRTLFQLMTGEAWNDIMFASVDAHGSLGPTIYYISYVAIVLLLFSNVFIGLVVDRFQDMEDEKNKDKREFLMQKRIKRFQRIQGVVLKRRITRFIKHWLHKHRQRRQQARADAAAARRRAARRSAPSSSPEGNSGKPRPVRGASTSALRAAQTTSPNNESARDRRLRLVQRAQRGGEGEGEGGRSSHHSTRPLSPSHAV